MDKMRELTCPGGELALPALHLAGVSAPRPRPLLILLTAPLELLAPHPSYPHTNRGCGGGVVEDVVT